MERRRQDTRFHLLKRVAVGARVLINSNVNLSKGAANGSEATVLRLDRDPAGTIHKIWVHIHATNVAHAITKSERNVRRLSGGRVYCKRTFPLQLAYAISGHASQGANFARPTLIHIRKGFVPGLGYVICSRNTHRDQMHIVGGLRADMFVPVPPLTPPKTQT